MLTGDVTAHAEMLAIRAACATAAPATDGQWPKPLAGHEIYCSGQPCMMCLGAVYWSGIDAVYFGQDLDAAGRIGFEDALQYQDFAQPYKERRVKIRQLYPELAEPTYHAWACRPGNGRRG